MLFVINSKERSSGSGGLFLAACSGFGYRDGVRKHVGIIYNISPFFCLFFFVSEMILMSESRSDERDSALSGNGRRKWQATV